MKIVFVISAAAAGLLVSQPASAQDASPFTGPYISIAGGLALPDDSSDGTIEFDRGGNGTFGETVTTSSGANAFSPGFCNGTAKGNNAGAGCTRDDNEYDIAVRGGYDFMIGSDFVLGGLIEVGKSGYRDTATAFSTTPAAYTFVRAIDYTAALRVRGGFPVGTVGLAYATGGVAAAKMDDSFTTTNTLNSFTTTNGDDWALGYQLGGGFEYALTPRISLGVEYLYNDFRDDNYYVAIGTGTAGATNPFVLAGGVNARPVDDRAQYHNLRASVSYRF